ncbi:glutamate synthase [Petrotoga sp. 8T1HF07.NaAc.6.1]|uniref:glutamate synthase large subunit n=1 Tax=Petrotoga sp. 8T1HF07.NaAc.6.1 TaxID=1351838 RepID=UPI00192AAD8B|nr:glutamate synthase large subunit [Petrotoga sp. 8T1HF07.NaAc.6.1]MBL5981282.1 glutamate synthase [Petrotoga sp. 8T1HF07.NaAc.6.1]
MNKGLYDPKFEHDACGVGLVASTKGIKSHEIVDQSLTVLKNMAHRGARGRGENDGDGAGLLLQLPHDFLLNVSKHLGFILPNQSEYAVGMIFCPRDKTLTNIFKQQFEKIVNNQGQKVIGWRDVPINKAFVGPTALKSMPSFLQVFIAKNPTLKSGIEFERKLYLIRKKSEKEIKIPHTDEDKNFYIASLSSKTIVYKGMLTAEQLKYFFPDLTDPLFKSAFSIVHSRFSTNTFPSWERAHPYRYMVHNGEINTIIGNVNWMKARQSKVSTDIFGENINDIFPIIDEDGSDSAMFDNNLEFLYLSGRSLPHSIMMMIPEPWENNQTMDAEKKAFYEFHSCLMEPWDGPAAIIFTDGTKVGATLDRNGLRPLRYYITDDELILASEAGVLEIPPQKILSKGRITPGNILLLDIDKGRILNNEEIKRSIVSEKPYFSWVQENIVNLEDLPEHPKRGNTEIDNLSLTTKQKCFGYTFEDIEMIIEPMVMDASDPVGAMGDDTPLAVLSERPKLLYEYFKQLFAQVTNPPIDAIREKIVTSTHLYIGSEGNLIDPSSISCRQIKIKNPILTNDEMEKIKNIDLEGFKAITLPILYKVKDGEDGLKTAIANLFQKADSAINDGANILILTDKGVNQDYAPIPALLAVSGMHHHLVRKENRTDIGIILESAEPREVHHFCTLISYGASAINPYLTYESIESLVNKGYIKGLKYEEAVQRYRDASLKGIQKVLSKLGISTLQGYQGAQTFEIVGIKKSFVDQFFTGTTSQIEGIGLKEIAQEVSKRHSNAFDQVNKESMLDSEGLIKWRAKGEYHLYNPESIYYLQNAVKNNDYELLKKFSQSIVDEDAKLYSLRSLFEFNFHKTKAIPIDEVEPVESIVKRFKTGAMSFGSISQEAHEAIAIAMNRIGAKSNTGEGGEDSNRFIKERNGDSKNSSIKQVASGRFGVTINYLNKAQEIQIKIAQGAKPGEGGELPGNKVYPWVAKVRNSIPGVTLISPPPHHDIYSIEDLAELIYDLKNANRNARINVKLVSKSGVGTIAAGVAKAGADVILISGFDGGTGASPRTSIRHAGLPWELGLAETHQTLVMNKLRDRVTLETDGKLLTGKDIVIAALLGAEEFGFATIVLVALGCVMMRVCNLDTCPVGIATQNPELRKNFKGDPQYVVNLMYFLASEVREYMGKLGFRTVSEMVGRVDKLKQKEMKNHWKAHSIDLSKLLHKPEIKNYSFSQYPKPINNGLSDTLDITKLLPICQNALENGEKIEATLDIKNVNRTVGTILGSEIIKRYGEEGLPEDTIKINFKGSAGQSFGAFIPKGETLILEGDSNDYIAKGLSGGKIIVYPPKNSRFNAEENVIVGNVALYGATSGEIYISGLVGERFAVRNSGATAVVEGVGEHGCEYMTGGKVVILGKTGRNFAAGMSGGIAYVYDKDNSFESKCNKDTVLLEKVEDENEESEIKELIKKHYEYTSSNVAKNILVNWEKAKERFVKVIPKDYKRMMDIVNRMHIEGITGEEALMKAFEENYKQQSLVQTH